MRFAVCVRPLDSLLGSLRGCLDGFPDKRRGINTTYGMGDIGMAAFSVFFMQSPSFLAHQRQFEESHGDTGQGSACTAGGIPGEVAPTAPACSASLKSLPTITSATCSTQPLRHCCIRYSPKPLISFSGSTAASTCFAASADTC